MSVLRGSKKIVIIEGYKYLGPMMVVVCFSGTSPHTLSKSFLLDSPFFFPFWKIVTESDA